MPSEPAKSVDMVQLLSDVSQLKMPLNVSTVPSIFTLRLVNDIDMLVAVSANTSVPFITSAVMPSLKHRLLNVIEKFSDTFGSTLSGTVTLPPQKNDADEPAFRSSDVMTTAAGRFASAVENATIVFGNVYSFEIIDKFFQE